MNTLSEVIHAARKRLGEDDGKVLAAVPTIAREGVSMNDGGVLALNYGLTGTVKGVHMSRGRKKTRGASAYVQSQFAHLMVIVRHESIAIHQLKMPNKVDKLIETHPVSAFFYQQNPAKNEVDTILTIDGNPFYVKRTFGPDLRATLQHHGIEPSVTADI